MNSIVLAIDEKKFMLKREDADIKRNRTKAHSEKGCWGYCSEILFLLLEGITKHTKKFIVSFSLIFTQALFFNLVYYQYPSILTNTFGLSQD